MPQLAGKIVWRIPIKGQYTQRMRNKGDHLEESYGDGNGSKPSDSIDNQDGDLKQDFSIR